MYGHQEKSASASDFMFLQFCALTLILPNEKKKQIKKISNLKVFVSEIYCNLLYLGQSNINGSFEFKNPLVYNMVLCICSWDFHPYDLSNSNSLVYKWICLDFRIIT